MIHLLQYTTTPYIAEDTTQFINEIASKLNIKISEIKHVQLLNKSIDARSFNIKINIKCNVYVNEEYVEKPIAFNFNKLNSNSKKVIIVGAGPAGLFAALKLIENGIKPIVIERGKTVRDRRRDLAAINKEHIVNPDSNYCFGEGGAGTYSDGKLYTRSTKRGDVTKVLENLVFHGAKPEVLYEAHPHVGTNKLPKIIENIRETILNYGGEIYFNSRVTDFIIKNNEVKGAIVSNTETNSTKEIIADAVILATGHSARDIYEWFFNNNFAIEAKPFAMGVRVEHQQELIDNIQYHCKTHEEWEEKREFLPPAPYSWVQQINNRGVYSFCMCPGGIIAPCATSPEEIVTNGWSPSKRNNAYSNSGIVVAIGLNDLDKYKQFGALAGLQFQKELEQMAWQKGNKNQTAPAQRLVDFTQNKLSSTLPVCSYQPGVKSSPLHEWLPPIIGKSLQQAFIETGKKMRGYLTNEALIVGVESRTSTPVRIPRDKDSLQHPEIKNFYPCGEGAGYAGGIISAAIDGERCAEAIANIIN